jgi:pyruvate dehydrogenase E1 component alpha subunit
MTDNEFEVTKKEALDLYFKMVLTRKTEEKHDELFQKQILPVYTHLSLGQEAVGCGVAALLRPEDYLIGTHRGVAEYVGKGMSIKDIFLEYGGRANGISAGRAGLHLHSPDLGILPLAASLGTDFSLAVGAGLTIRNKGLDKVVVDYFGEGAAEQADFHPAMNMAVLYGLSVIYCCCTNQFVEYHSYRDTTCTADIAAHAASYCMAWKIVEDGNDLFAVGRAMKEALSHVRKNKAPYFIEFKSYRLAPHHTGDQCVYRNKEEVEAAWSKDPISKAQKSLVKKRWATKKDFKRIEEDCGRTIDQAVDELMKSSLPDAGTVMDHAMTS